MKIKLIMLSLYSLAFAGTEDRTLATPYEQLVTFLGKPNFKISGQSGLTATVTISTPGTYALATDIPATTTSGQVISITSSDVIIDLSGKSITLGTGSGSAINCFTIAPNLSNIIIRNGVISNMNGNGISIGSGCSAIHLENLTITSCALSGITIAGASGALVTGIFLNNCLIQQCNTTTGNAYGLKLSYSTLFTIQDCSFNAQQATATTGNSYGVYLSNSTNGTFESCEAKNNSGSALTAGFYVDTGCSTLYFLNCDAKTNNSTSSATTGIAYGFFQTSSTNNCFEKCTAANNSAYALAAGFATQASAYSLFSECVAQNNYITGTLGTTGGYGFLANTATCKGELFDSCLAYGNKGSTDTASYGCGFSLNNSLCITIQNCTANANDGSTGGTGIGIEIKSAAVRCCIQNNEVITNTSTTVGKAYGIYDQSNPSTTLLSNNFAFANRDETTTPNDQNFITSYAQGNIVQTNNKTNIKGLTNSTYLNTSITP